jgi:Zn-dependent M28 family amino/carboxypeptidase
MCGGPVAAGVGASVSVVPSAPVGASVGRSDHWPAGVTGVKAGSRPTEEDRT